MSVQLKEVQKEESGDEEVFYTARKPYPFENQRVNLNDLVNRLNTEKKKERKTNFILTVAAISAVSIFGIILTL